MRNKKFGFLGLLLAFILVAASCQVPVRAASAEAKTGTINVSVGKAGVELTLYRVADVKDGVSTANAEFAGAGASLTNLGEAAAAQAAAQTLASWAVSQKISGTAATTGQSGSISYTDVAPDGLYLVAQTGGGDITTVPPSLAVVPYTDDGGNRVYETNMDLAAKTSDAGAVILQKADDTGAPVAGAVFRLDQNVYDAATGTSQWRSGIRTLTTNAAGQIAVSGMERGDYRFVELSAPEGYAFTNQPINFTIDKAATIYEGEDGRFYISSGTPIELNAVNVRQVNGSIQVTKTLVTIGNEGYIHVSSMVDRTFYAALFSDAAYTNRVSDVQAIVFEAASGSSRTVTFTGLDAGTYYVAETDENGTAITTGNDVFTPLNPTEGIVIGDGSNTGSAEIMNVMGDEQYLYEGSIVVTKNVVGANGSDWNPDDYSATERTFYFGVFDENDELVVQDVLVYEGENSQVIITNLPVNEGTRCVSSIPRAIRWRIPLW